MMTDAATASEAEPAPLAAVDIGTNSFHLVVARPSGNNRFDVLDREKEVVRLGRGSGDMKRLEPDAIDRGIEVLTRFRAIADSMGAEMVAVATSAVREAENRRDFISRARQEAGVQVDVVTGAEEARLIHLGVLQAVPIFDRRHLVIDIGGGSTEFVVGEGAEVLHARSLKLGAIRLTDRFLRDEPLKKKQLDACRRHISAFLAPAAKAITAFGFDVAVGSSGTIVSVATVARALAGDGPLRHISGESVSKKDLKRVIEALTNAKTVPQRTDVPGLDSKRADIIVGGALIVEQAFELLKIDELVVSDYALREGLLLDVLRRRGDEPSFGHLRDLRYQSVMHLAEIAPGERSHAEHATKLAVQLFDQTKDLHGLGEQHEELLEAAGLLANVGLFVSHDRHHLHSYYIIRNSDLLAGFTDHEVELIAQIARYHRKSPPRARHEDFARLSDDDQRAVRILAGMIRVAYALDRTRSGLVHGIEVTTTKRTIEITVDASGDPAIELYTADERKALLEDALGVSVGIGLR